MANLYTKTGDGGDTALYGGTRISKSDLRVECYGTVDEANSMLGLAYAHSMVPYVRDTVRNIQKQMFSLGAELASDEEGRKKLTWTIKEEDVSFLESVVDECTKQNGVSTHFVLPGVTEASAALQVARTIVRRAERSMIRLRERQGLDSLLLKYVNRLSDTIYALALYEETSLKQEHLREKVTALVREKLREAVGENDDESVFDLAHVKQMAERAEKKAQEINVPMVFTAVDNAGNLMLLHRMEGSLLASISISQSKAYTALSLKMSTDRVGELSQPGQMLYGIEASMPGKLVLFGGGYPCFHGEKIVGAIGVSGGSVEEDMMIAQYALHQT